MKILSTILYKEDAVIAMIAGTAYCIKSLPILSVPNAEGVFLSCHIIYLFLFSGCKGTLFLKQNSRKNTLNLHTMRMIYAIFAIQ